MSTYQTQASKIINAHPEQIYAIISDYHEGHPAILPSRYFTEMVVTAGGQGEGTTATVGMNMAMPTAAAGGDIMARAPMAVVTPRPP